MAQTVISYDSRQDKNMQKMFNALCTIIERLNTIIVNQETMIANQEVMIANQGVMIANQETMIANQEAGLSNQNAMIAILGTIVGKQDDALVRLAEISDGVQNAG
jgi:hypothetical protein